MKLFLKQFESLTEQSDQDGYERAIYVLERFSEAKSYQDMFEEEEDEPLGAMLGGFFRTIRCDCLPLLPSRSR